MKEYSIIYADPPWQQHNSKKPICAYKMIENFYPNQEKIELFARNKRFGWNSWGNEIKEENQLI